MEITIRFKDGHVKTYDADPSTWGECKGFIAFNEQIIRVASIKQLVVGVGSSEWWSLSPTLYARIQKSKSTTRLA